MELICLGETLKQFRIFVQSESKCRNIPKIRKKFRTNFTPRGEGVGNKFLLNSYLSLPPRKKFRTKVITAFLSTAILRPCTPTHESDLTMPCGGDWERGFSPNSAVPKVKVRLRWGTLSGTQGLHFLCGIVADS